MLALPIRGYHPLRPCFPDRFWLSHIHDWPGPGSLATTTGVSVDVLSSRYLDVSVPWVCLKPPMYSEVSYLLLITGNPKPRGFRSSRSPNRTPKPRSWSSGYRRWVSPFGNPRIKASSQLLAAYRSVVRPSSPISAKASTKCPYDT